MLFISEDRDIRKSIPNNVAQMFKHILNCIYQPELYHNGWKRTILTQHTLILNDAHREGNKKVTKIINDNIDVSYKLGYKEFFVELANNYNEQEMRKIIPKKVDDMGKGTVYEKYKWNADTLLNTSIINQFLKEVQNNSQSIYDIYK